MQSWADSQLEWLRRRFPGWDIWYVHHVGSLDTWCARPEGAPAAVFHADSPEELAAKITEALAG
jgi:hypothetical protein